MNSGRLFYAIFLLTTPALADGTTIGTIQQDIDFDTVVNQTGLYLFKESLPLDGYVESVCVFGKINTNTQDVTVPRLRGRVYLLFYDGSRVRRFPVRVNSDLPSCSSELRNPDIEVEMSDMVFVYIPPRCTIESNMPPVQFCPLQVNFESENATSQYFAGSDVEITDITDNMIQEFINMTEPTSNNTILLNINVTIVPEIEDDPPIVVAAVVPSVLAFIFICVILSCAAALVFRRCHSKKRNQDHSTRVVNDDLRESLMNHSGSSHLYSRKESTPNIYNDHRLGSGEYQDGKGVGRDHGAYYLLGRRGSDHDYEEPYFEPASREEDLLQQLKKMAIPVIEENELKLFEVLGSGAFGTVNRGVWSHKREGSDQPVEVEVAVKTMDGQASEEERVKFLQEAAIMGQFNHPNIIRLMGIITTAEKPLKILIEIMKNGDLRKHLHQIRPSPNEPVPAELAPTLLSYSRQIANGMMYLAVKSFVHRDLAARNVLVSDDGVCKIADFGLSRELQNQDFYTSHGGKIPVKWTAPEALHYRKYSTASDVWSYGCVLYEIWSLGHKPFQDVTNREAMDKVNSGFRLPPPAGSPRAIYDIMIQCWEPEADQRPAFLDIMTPLQKPDFQVLKWSSEDIKMYSEEARTLGAILEAGQQLHKDLQMKYLHANTQPASTEERDVSCQQRDTSCHPDSKESGYMNEESGHATPGGDQKPEAILNEDSGYVMDCDQDENKLTSDTAPIIDNGCADSGQEELSSTNAACDNGSAYSLASDSDEESGYAIPADQESDDSKDANIEQESAENKDHVSTEESGYALQEDINLTDITIHEEDGYAIPPDEEELEHTHHVDTRLDH